MTINEQIKFHSEKLEQLKKKAKEAEQKNLSIIASKIIHFAKKDEALAKILLEKFQSGGSKKELAILQEFLNLKS